MWTRKQTALYPCRELYMGDNTHNFGSLFLKFFFYTIPSLYAGTHYNETRYNEAAL